MRRLSLIALILLFFACRKNASPSTIQNKAISAFKMGRECLTVLPGRLNFVDSTLMFVNTSHLEDTTNSPYAPTVSYRWDFGDQTTTNETNPLHKYHFPGIYGITLTTYLNGQVSDSTTDTVQIIMGAREFNFNPGMYAISVAQATQKGAMVLFAENSGVSSYTYYLLRVDSLLNTKWVLPIPGDNSSIRLNGISRINDNQYILSGNYSVGNTNTFSLSEIDSAGKQIWVKYFNEMPGMNNYTLPLSDGGILTTGTVNMSGNRYGAILKCDANGNEAWTRVFDSTQSISQINQIFETDSGYVFSATSPDSSPNLVLTEVGFNGNTIKQTVISPTYPLTPGSANAFYNGNTIIVYDVEGMSNYVYWFDSKLAFYGRRIFTGLAPIHGGITVGNTFVMYANEGQESELDQILPDGTLGWGNSIDHIIYTSCSGLTDGVRRTCKGITFTTDNEIIVVADGQNINNTSSLYLEKFTATGNVK